MLATARHYISQDGQLQRTDLRRPTSASPARASSSSPRRPRTWTSPTAACSPAPAPSASTTSAILKNTAGLYLQGWPVDSEGKIATDPSDLNRLRSINVGSVGGTAEATTRAQLNANLQSSQPVSPAATAAAASPPTAGAYDATTNSMAMYDAEAGTGVKPDFELTVPVSDSKGGQRTIAISFLKSTTPNQWYAEIRAIPASDVVTGAGLANGQLKTGLVAFTQDGRWTSTP